MNSMYKSVGLPLLRFPSLAFNHADKVAADEMLRAGIAVASPSLFRSLMKDQTAVKVSTKVDRYYRRMSSRPTPFGLFASVALGKFESTTDLCKGEQLVTKTRPDMSWFLPLIESLERNKDIRNDLTFFVNPELVLKSGRIWISDQNKKVVNLRATPPAVRSIQLAKKPISYGHLVARLMREFVGSTFEQIDQLCSELCNLRVLLSELRMPLTSNDPLSELLRRIQGIDAAATVETQLQKFSDSICDWDKSETKSARNYMDLLDLVTELAEAKNKDLLQVDSASTLKGRFISQRVADEMAKAAELCLRLNKPYSRSPFLISFMNSFGDRYQLGREVPILELLHPVFGLGSPYDSTRNSRESGSYLRNTTLLTMAASAMKHKTLELNLTEEQIRALEFRELTKARAPTSLDLFAFVSAASRSDIDDGQFKVVLAPRIGEEGAGRTLGRFTHLLGDEAVSHLQLIADLDRADLDSIVADVAFWPDSNRAANILQSARVQTHSITSNCGPVDGAINIPLSEISVGLEDTRFYARWTRTGQKIIAKSSNMLTFARVPEVIRFLLEISSDGYAQLGPFDWGPAEQFQFLPRISVGNIVLRAAEWKLGTLAKRCTTSMTLEEFQLVLEEWRKEWGVTELVQLSTGKLDDNYLLLDLLKSKDIEELWRMRLEKQFTTMVAQEYIAAETWHSTESGNFVTEIVGSFVRSDLLDSPKESKRGEVIEKKLRCLPTRSDFLRPPGSEWLYLRLGCHRTVHEKVIVHAANLASRLMKANHIKNWFFIRYGDPQDHLRLRFHVSPEHLYSETMPSVCKWAAELVSSELCSDFSFDTYDREIERYGGVGAIRQVEEFFCADSALVASMLQIPKLGDLDRIVVGALSVNALLASFGMSLETRWQWLRTRLTPSDRRTFSGESRRLRPLLSDLLSNDDNFSSKDYSELLKVLSTVNEVLVPKSKVLLELDKRAQLTVSVPNLCQSLVHMHCIRLFGLGWTHEVNVRAVLASVTESLIKRHVA